LLKAKMSTLVASVANHVIGEQISLVDATSARALQFRLPQSTPSIACS
jgi:hypothetical protein